MGSRETVDAVLADETTAPVSVAERALYTFARAANRTRGQLTDADYEPVRAAGWSDEALYDALTVVALFNFMNIWVDGGGVADLPAEVYESQGRRMAKGGYGG